MARRSREVGTIKSYVLGAAFAACLALPAHAENTLAFSATAAVTTDYVFRGISQTKENPAVQPEVDLTYGIFYAGIWASNVDFGNNGLGRDIANVEIDYYAGITPMWKSITFNIGVIYYTYPGAFDPGAELDYFEVKTGASYTFAEKLTVGITNYWTPENTGNVGHNDVVEVTAAYAFAGKLFNFFSPSISALYGHQWADENSGGVSYNYWNAGLTLGFLEHLSADVRYWDTSDPSTPCPSTGVFACDSRVVGTIKAVY